MGGEEGGRQNRYPPAFLRSLARFPRVQRAQTRPLLDLVLTHPHEQSLEHVDRLAYVGPLFSITRSARVAIAASVISPRERVRKLRPLGVETKGSRISINDLEKLRRFVADLP